MWNIFKFAELTEVMRQYGDIEFIEIPNKIRFRNFDESVQTRLNTRFVKENVVNYSRNTLHVYRKQSDPVA